MATYQDKLDRIISSLSKNTGLTNIVPGSLAGQLSQSVAYEQMLVEGTLEDDIINNSILLAKDRALDTIGDEFFGIERLQEVRTSVTESMKLVKFYVKSGTFGDINNNNDITIPEGTVLEGFVNSYIVRFRTSKETVLPAGDSEKFIGCELIQGSNDTLPTGTITKHYFTGYANAISNSLLITNIAVVATGRPRETDDNYRYRITNSLSAFTRTNTDGIMDTIISTTGVAYAFIDQSSNGGGTFTAYVQGMSPMTSDELIDDVKFALNEQLGPWVSYTVSKMNYLGLQIAATVTTNNSLYYTGNEGFVNNIKDTVSSYVNNFFGDIFDVKTLISVIKNSNPDITDVKLDSVYLFTGVESDRSMSAIDPESSIERYISIDSTEKIVIEPVSYPITVQVQ